MSLSRSSLRIAITLLLLIAAQGLARPQSTNAPNGTDSQVLGGPIIRNVVILNVSVVDNEKKLVTDLVAKDFTIFEDGQQQRLLIFSSEDAPVSIGIVVDDSGSMRHKRDLAAKMAMELVTACNPMDEFLVVKFNDQPFVDQDFTSDVNLVQKGLGASSARGGTALYDALLATSSHLMKRGQQAKKVLIVISDGDDNSSRINLAAVLRDFQSLNRPAVYAVGLLKDDVLFGGQARHTLQNLSAETGGAVFFPKNSREMHEAALRIAAEIRNQYSVGYRTSSAGGPDQYRKLSIVVDRNDVIIHARPGYFPEPPASLGASKPHK